MADNTEYKLKQFAYDEWVMDNKLQVVDSAGNPIEILKTDANNKEYPIIGCVKNQYGEYPCQFSKDGRMSSGSPKGVAYFLIPKDTSPLTEFQKRILALMTLCGCYQNSETHLRKATKPLMNIAYKELRSTLKKKGYIIIKKDVFEAMTGVDKNIRAEVSSKLDLPLWHVWNGKDKPLNVLALLENGKYAVIRKNIDWVGKSVKMYISLEDLSSNLPKEE